MRKPEAVIFDMDGVLIDSEPIHIEIEKQLFKKLGISVSAEVHLSYLGTAADYMYADIKSRFGLPNPISELLEIDELFRCDYFSSLSALDLNDGVLTLLNELKLAGLKLAVATSSSPELTRILLERCGISSVFDAIVTTKEAGKSKPSPDVYLLASRRIGVEAANCLVFEDSPIGLSAAKSAGMCCIAVQTDSVDVQELSAADYLLSTLRGITLSRLNEIFSGSHLANSQF